MMNTGRNHDGKLLVLLFLSACAGTQPLPKTIQPVSKTPSPMVEFGTTPTATKAVFKSTLPFASVTPATTTVALSQTPVPSMATSFPKEKEVALASPDKKWVAHIALAGGSVQVERSDGTIKWIIDDPNLSGFDGGFWVEKWSSNGQYVYLGTSPEKGVYSFVQRWYGFYPAYNLLRLDLNTGEVVLVLEPKLDPLGSVYWNKFALSPDETQLVYARWGEHAVVVRNLNTKNEQILKVEGDYPYIGDFVWSPNSDKVIFTMMAETTNSAGSRDNYPADFLLVRLDVDKMVIAKLISGREDKWFPVAIEWTEEEWVTLFEPKGDSYWLLNSFTAYIKPSKATPTP